MINKLCIIGVGLIGGSIGLDIKRLKLANSVVGVVRRPESIDESIRSGAVDSATLDPISAAKDADLIILATPISNMLAISKMLRIKEDAIVIDVASVKGRLVPRLEKIFGGNYIGTHPMAGSEKKGVRAAKPQIFNGTVCIITPTKKTSKRTLDIVNNFWNQLGSKTVILSPKEHDKVVALISHLPHLVAFSLVNSVASLKKGIPYIGPGFKDSTRIAGSPPQLWQEICEWNKEEILASINRFQNEFGNLKKLIEKNNWNGFLKKLETAKELRDRL